MHVPSVQTEIAVLAEEPFCRLTCVLARHYVPVTTSHPHKQYVNIWPIGLCFCLGVTVCICLQYFNTGPVGSDPTNFTKVFNVKHLWSHEANMQYRWLGYRFSCSQYQRKMDRTAISPLVQGMGTHFNTHYLGTRQIPR